MFFGCFHGGARPKAHLRLLLEAKNTGVLSPHRGSKISPDPGPDSRLMRMSTRRSVGLGKSPGCAALLFPREMSLLQKRSTSGAPVSLKKNVKFSLKKQFGPAQCLKAVKLPRWVDGGCDAAPQQANQSRGQGGLANGSSGAGKRRNAFAALVTVSFCPEQGSDWLPCA
jgi:hypothetical protein